MISYKKIDKREGIDFSKTKDSVECMIFHSYYFKDVGFKYQPYVCNACHDFVMTVQVLSDFFILTVKNIDYRVYISNVDKKATVYLLNNSVLNDKGVLQMAFKPNKTPVKIIKEGSLGGTYFRDFYSGVNNKWYKHSWKEFKDLESIDRKYYRSEFYDVNLNKYGVKCGTSLRFWEQKCLLI